MEHSAVRDLVVPKAVVPDSAMEHSAAPGLVVPKAAVLDFARNLFAVPDWVFGAARMELVRLVAAVLSVVVVVL